MESGVSVTARGGIRKLRPGPRKISTIRMTSASERPHTSASSATVPRPADPSRIRVGVAQRLEDPLHRGGIHGLHRLAIHLVGVLRERVLEPSDRLVIREIDGAGAVAGPVLPGAHHRVLHQGQLILIVAQVVQHAVHQPRRNRATGHGHRAGDGRAQAVSAHPPDQEQPRVHRLGQTGEVHAVPDEVRPHRDDDVDRGTAAGRRPRAAGGRRQWLHRASWRAGFAGSGRALRTGRPPPAGCGRRAGARAGRH